MIYNNYRWLDSLYLHITHFPMRIKLVSIHIISISTQILYFYILTIETYIFYINITKCKFNN